MPGGGGVLPAVAATATNVAYLDATGNAQTCATATVVESGTTTWNAGWYVVNADVTITSRITVSGSVNLILADGATLTANAGVGVSSGNNFTIYGQTGQTGQLTATGETNNAGIGGDYGGNGGTITINGGIVTATGGTSAAGIGGGYDGSGGTITINGGAVTANGGSIGAYIGSTGAGIGGGYDGSGGTITINGGAVTANGGSTSAGIGDGYEGSGGTFSTGTDGNAFIIAIGGTDAASTISDQSYKTASGTSGIIFEGDTGTMYGTSVTLTTDAEIPAGKTLTIKAGQTLTIDSGVFLTNNGTLINNGTLTNNGIILDNGVLTNSGTLNGSGAINTYCITFKYNDGGATADTFQYANKDNKLTSLPTPTPTRDGYVFEGWYLPDGATRVTTETVFSADTTLTAKWLREVPVVITWVNDTEAIRPASVEIDVGDTTGLGVGYALTEDMDWKFTFKVPEEVVSVTVKAEFPDDFAHKDAYTISVEGYNVTITHNHSYDADPEDLSCNACNASITPYTVTFDANGGAVTPATTTANRVHKLTSLPTPTRAGYVFEGWFLPDGATRVTMDTVFTADTTVMAMWSVEQEEEDEEEKLPSDVDVCLDQADYTFETYKDFEISQEFDVHNLLGGRSSRVSIKRLSRNSLLSGVRLKYDKKTGKLLLSRTASKAGTFTYTFRLDERIGRVKREGVETTFTFIVKDMRKLTSDDPDYNPAAGKTIKTDIPMFATDGGFAGLLNVSISTRNSISAKIQGVSKRTLSFRGKWQENVEGELSAILTARKGEELELVLKKDGNLCAYLSNVTGEYGSEFASTEQGVAAVATKDDYAKYVTDRDGLLVDIETPDGTEQVILKINKNGRVTYKSLTNRFVRGSAQVLLNAGENGEAHVYLIKTIGRTQYMYLIQLD